MSEQSVAETLRIEMLTQRIDTEKTRIRSVILALGTQVKNRALLDAFLSNLNIATSVDGRLPFTPVRVVTTQDKTKLLHNTLAHAILNWGKLARSEITEAEYKNDDLLLLEQIAKSGFKTWGAYPKERNSAIHVLRNVVQEKKLRDDRAAAEVKALEAKARIREEAFDKPQEPAKTGLEQEEPDGPESTTDEQSPLEGARPSGDHLGGATSGDEASSGDGE